MLKKQYQNGKGTCLVTFELPKNTVQSEPAGAIKVLGDFNNWNWAQGLTLQANGEVYSATIELEAARSYQYRYLVENGPWLNDPAADRYQATPFYGIDNSVLELEAAPAAPVIEPAKATLKKKESIASDSVAAPTPARPKAAKKTTKDNIKKHIEGIGPKIEKLLAEKGITTFQALAEANLDLLKEILAEAGPRFRMHNPGTWSEQARLAADEKWEELETLKQELKGGKRVS